VRRGELNRWWSVGVAIVMPLVRLLFRVRVRGLEHVPLTGPAILAFNHVSVLDGPVLAAETAYRIRRETRFLVAAEMFHKPVWGWVLRRYEQIPVRRGGADQGALDEVVETVRHGAMAALAPEGRVNGDGDDGLQRIKSGVARIALPTGAPVIPVGIWGTQRRWPRGRIRWSRPLRPQLALSFGPPMLPVGDVGTQDDIDDFRDRLRTQLETQVSLAQRMAGTVT
jgi:1-acyl-sn-glycerol-3-phosphate acyltransferase